MAWYVANVVNALTLGLLLFMLSSGLTLAFSLMGVLSFAHGALYALGAYLGWQIAHAVPDSTLGFALALVGAPTVVGLLGLAIEVGALQRVRPRGHLPELLVTCGVAYLVGEAIPLVWGRGALESYAPASLDHATAVLPGATISGLRLLGVGIGLATLGGFVFVARCTRVGLILRAALTHPQMLAALGIRLPRLHAAVFALSCALAALAGVLGGNLFVIDPAMANSMIGLGFAIIVIGGLGSVVGALLASLLTAALLVFGASSTIEIHGVPIARLAAALPYLAMVIVLAVRPAGLLGQRE